MNRELLEYVSMKVNDLIVLSDDCLNNAYWKVLGIYLGGPNKESVIHLERLDIEGPEHEMYVPEVFLRLLINVGLVTNYRLVKNIKKSDE
jgi:hypothetical protein